MINERIKNSITDKTKDESEDDEEKINLLSKVEAKYITKIIRHHFYLCFFEKNDFEKRKMMNKKIKKNKTGDRGIR